MPSNLKPYPIEARASDTTFCCTSALVSSQATKAHDDQQPCAALATHRSLVACVPLGRILFLETGCYMLLANIAIAHKEKGNT
eukprot:1142488-Pelagomonas_calceolata.AAC.5